PLHACHVMLLAVRGWMMIRRPGAGARSGRSLTEQLLDLLDVGGVDNLVGGQTAGASARLVLEQVTHAGLLAHDLSAAGGAEPLLGGGVSLVLRQGCRFSLGLVRRQCRCLTCVGLGPVGTSSVRSRTSPGGRVLSHSLFLGAGFVAGRGVAGLGVAG